MDEEEAGRMICAKKKPYSTKGSAKKAAKAMKKRYGGRTFPYACFYCDKWHLSSRPPN